MLMELCSIEQLKSLPMWLPLILLAFGSFSVSKLLISFIKWVYANFLRPAKNLKNHGSWALITGPIDGIGKAFAFQLAQKGLNLVLVGRNPDKLKHVSDAILAKEGNTKIETVVLDFSCDLSDGLTRIGEVIDGLDVGVLINNVGCCYPYAKYLHELDEKLMADLIKINVEGTTKVTHAVLPGMLKGKRGAIVNISSAGGGSILPSYPLYTVYAAAKGYFDQFSKSLYVEYKKSGIDVQCQSPCYVATKMESIRKSSFLVPSADSYVRAALRWVGYEHRCTPYWPHSVLWALANVTPEFIIDAIALWYFLSLRKKGKLKDARKRN